MKPRQILLLIIPVLFLGACTVSNSGKAKYTNHHRLSISKQTKSRTEKAVQEVRSNRDEGGEDDPLLDPDAQWALGFILSWIAVSFLVISAFVYAILIGWPLLIKILIGIFAGFAGLCNLMLLFHFIDSAING